MKYKRKDLIRALADIEAILRERKQGLNEDEVRQIREEIIRIFAGQPSKLGTSGSFLR